MSQNNKIMEKSKSLSKRLKAIRLESNITKEKSKLENKTKDLEEYPKLRKPKPATLLKIQARGKKSFDIIQSKNESNKEDIQVPLRQEFLKKKQELEDATKSFLKKYEVYKKSTKLLDEEDNNYWDSDEAQPLTLHNNVNLHLENEKLKCKNSQLTKDNNTKPLNFIEQHVIGIIYTKVNAHPNGFFAENLPFWYKKTFDKEIPQEWFELVKRSQQFYIENIQNTIVLYPKELKEVDEEEVSNKNVDIKASGDKALEVEENKLKKSSDKGIRCKHLQKSLNELTQQQNAGSDEKFVKPKDRLCKASINKKYVLVKK